MWIILFNPRINLKWILLLLSPSPLYSSNTELLKGNKSKVVSGRAGTQTQVSKRHLDVAKSLLLANTSLIWLSDFLQVIYPLWTSVFSSVKKWIRVLISNLTVRSLTAEAVSDSWSVSAHSRPSNYWMNHHIYLLELGLWGSSSSGSSKKGTELLFTPSFFSILVGEKMWSLVFF